MPPTWDANRWSLEAADILGELAVLRTAADESARHVRGLYFTFLLFAFYVAVIVFSTTDEQLLKQTGARLPLLNVELPLLGFYIFVPWLVLVFHLHLLNQFFLLSRKLHNLNRAIGDLPKNIQHTQRELPFPLIFSHMVIGRHHAPLIRWAFSTAVVVTVVIVPVALLLAIQWKFLPYHSSWINLNHQITVILSLFLVWAFWPRTASPTGRWGTWWPTGGELKNLFRVFTAVLSTLVVVIVTAVFLVPPGDGIERLVEYQPWLDTLHRNLDLHEKTLMTSEPPPEMVAAYKAAGEPPEKVWIDHGKPLRLMGRDLRYADFTDAILWDVDLRDAQLQGADFSRAQLQGADFSLAELQGADFGMASLRGALLNEASLEGATLGAAKLQGAQFAATQLQGAHLGETQLQGADLLGANLTGAYLGYAQLQGADFTHATLQGAYLREAQLQGVFLQGTALQGANFREAQLQGTDLRGAEIHGTNFRKTNLSLADMRGLHRVPVGSDYSNDFQEMEYLESRLIHGEKSWPDDARKRVKKALSRLWDIAFDLPFDRTKVSSSQAPDAMYDPCGLFAKFPPPPTVDAFEKNRIAFLANLSCSDKYVATGMVRRPTRRFPTTILESSALAHALLDKNCPAVAEALKEMNAETREKLERLAQQHKEPAP